MFTLRNVYDLVSKFFDSFAEDTISGLITKQIYDGKIKRIISKEKSKAYEELHSLVDANEGNCLVISSEFINFFNHDAKLIMERLLGYDSCDLTGKSISKQIGELISLYNHKFSNVNPYEKSLGANFLSRYFEICFRYKRRLYHSFIKEDIPRLLEYELKEDALRKVEEDTTEILDLLHKMYDYITVNSEVTQQHNIANLEQKAKTTIEKFSELYEKVLIFETPGQDIKLKDVFVWPEYRTGILRNDQDDLSIVIQKFLCNSLGQYLYDKVLFGKKPEREYNLFLILGMGGMGKSSLLAKIAHEILQDNIQYNTGKIFFIKCSLLGDDNKNLINNIMTYLEVAREDLSGAIIFLDAYDEYILDNSKKQGMLETFCQDIFNLNCKAIITSRENYIDTQGLQKVFVIKLLTFNYTKRSEWLNKYNKELSEKVRNDILNYHDERDIKGEEFIGIPIIIYMVASNNILISDYESKYEFYDELFGKYGIWYTRMYDINHPAIMSHNVAMFEFILHVAETMFCNKMISVGREQIENIISDVSTEKEILYLKNWYGVITYFRKNRINEIEFAHKSIFEYYIANRIYNIILEVISEKDIKNKLKILNKIFSDNVYTEEIQYFLSGFIIKESDKINKLLAEETLRRIFDVDFLLFKTDCFHNSSKLYNYFANTFNSFYLLWKILFEPKQFTFYQYVGIRNIEFFLKNNRYEYLYMKQLDLSNIVMHRVVLSNIDFTDANLENSDFSYSDFSSANLKRCNLKNANLFSTILSNANLEFADLRGANLNNIIINKDPKKFLATKIDINQIKYFWPEISWFYACFEIYVDGQRLACQEEIQNEFNKIRGF